MGIDEQYFKRFGLKQKGMAADINALEACKSLIIEHNLKAILDCGSGLSTAFFNQNFVEVTSVDDDHNWAANSQQFVQEALGKHIEIFSIPDILEKSFDFTFYDYGDMETRIYYLKLIIHLSKKFIYLDDMHIDYYSCYVNSILRDEYKLTVLDEYVDEFGRYGALLEKLNYETNLK